MRLLTLSILLVAAATAYSDEEKLSCCTISAPSRQSLQTAASTTGTTQAKAQAPVTESKTESKATPAVPPKDAATSPR